MWKPGRELLRYSLYTAFACAGLLLAACNAAEPAAAPAAAAATAEDPDRPVVLFLGDSLTAGYGLAGEEAYPALIQQHIDAEGLDFRVVNAGVSGDTTAGGLRRIDWLLRLPIAVLVLELGGNDMLRGLDVEAMHRNLRQIVERTRVAHPDAALVVAGMLAPPNLGSTYVRAFDAVFPSVAREYDGVLYPFLLEGVAGVPSLNQADGIHPTAEGHRRIAEHLWPRLAPVLEAAARR